MVGGVRWRVLDGEDGCDGGLWSVDAEVGLGCGEGAFAVVEVVLGAVAGGGGRSAGGLWMAESDLNGDGIIVISSQLVGISPNRIHTTRIILLCLWPLTILGV
ncbi:hypothetical protein HanXRQr2_Chr12g0537361 [Helianthus annuus]|uniref:Uncharacterized protein n=1 Tax=Helianthus annuus TaxID=4232 RepID=A0A9K3HFX2_HELAN|nr:hypothetical protein HanXRQr2_Chr12g0537361 [Helianthus annuus]